jgi:predicted GNAT family N-acyltransferase
MDDDPSGKHFFGKLGEYLLIDTLNTLEILIRPWSAAKKDAFSVRHEVFIHEQGVPEELELDEFDSVASHALIYQGEQCIATARLVFAPDNSGQIGRMAVLAPYRGQGLGRQILERFIGLARAKGLIALSLHAQVSAIPFYEKLGFIAEGPIYDEAGIAHRNMMLILSK